MLTETVARISDASDSWYFVTTRRKHQGGIPVRHYWADVWLYSLEGPRCEEVAG